MSLARFLALAKKIILFCLVETYVVCFPNVGRGNLLFVFS